ncbi:MAG: hypothetical protein JO127_15085 [Caulobacteraceae bacterium]|nr:hypothetical protein [Caulobacteraceae bacterium]
MRDEMKAIVVRRTGEAWRWTVRDELGFACASGSAPSQEAAMQTAWRVACLTPPRSTRIYPDLVVEHEGA